MKKPSIVTKLVILISSVTLIFFAAGLSMGYFGLFTLLGNTAGEDQNKMAQLMASAVSKTIDENAALLGADIYKTVSDSDLFSGVLKDFKLGDTGFAALVDDKAYLVFAPGIKPFSNKFCSSDELQKVSNSNAGWFFMDGVYGRQGRVVASFCAVENPLLSKNGMVWRVFVVREAREIFAPLKEFIYRAAASGAVLLILLALTVFILGRLFVRPIRKLQEGIERLSRGDLDYRVSVDSGDEIGRLAASFNKMVEGLGETTTSITNLNREAASRKKAEDKVKQLSEEWQKAFESIKGAVSSANPQANTNNLLKEADNLAYMAKIEAGKIELNMKPVDIKGLIKNAVFVFEPKIREKGLDMKLNIPRGNINIEADADRLNQVLGILIDNAVKFTTKGYVAISVKESNTDVECGITDTGLGIQKEKIPALLEEFGHLNFSIARGIVEKHGGKVSIESDPGKLTKVAFTLPKQQK